MQARVGGILVAFKSSIDVGERGLAESGTTEFVKVIRAVPDPQEIYQHSEQAVFLDLICQSHQGLAEFIKCFPPALAGA